jgi:hypothetical protein
MRRCVPNQRPSPPLVNGENDRGNDKPGHDHHDRNFESRRHWVRRKSPGATRTPMRLTSFHHDLGSFATERLIGGRQRRRAGRTRRCPIINQSQLSGCRDKAEPQPTLSAAAKQRVNQAQS